MTLPPLPLNLNALIETLRRALSPVVSQNEAAARIMLQAPNGSVFAVTVDNTGTLTVAAESGKSGP